jgi:O-antigen ligase
MKLFASNGRSGVAALGQYLTPGTVIAALVGLIACAMAIEVAALPLKFAVTISAGIVGGVMLILLGSFERMRLALVVAIALGLSISLDISFFHYLYAPGTFVLRVTGAQAITVSLTLMGVLAYIAVSYFENLFRVGTKVIRLRYQSTLITAQLLFMAAGLLSLPAALDKPLVFYEEVRLVTLLVCSLTVMNMPRRHVEVFLLALALSVCLQTAIAGAQWVTGSTLGLGIFGEEHLIRENIDYQVIRRATGTVGHSNILAYFYEIVGPLVFALMLWSRCWWQRLIYFAAVAATAAGMLFTLSRAAWMTVPVSFGIVFIVVYGRRIWRLVSAVWGVILALVVASGLVYALPIILERVLGDDAGSSSHRMPLNYAAMSVIEQFPIFGVGLNNFATAFHVYDTTRNSLLFISVDHVVHNLYLLVWGEVGLVGLLAFLWIFLSAFWVARTVAKRGDSWQRAVATGAACGLLAQMIHGMFDPGFKLSLTISQLIYVQLGLIGNLAINLPKRADARVGARAFRNAGWPPRRPPHPSSSAPQVTSPVSPDAG